MGISSIFVMILTSAFAAGILLLLFFAVPLMFIIGVEHNIFPDLPSRKYKSMALFYFCALVAIPFGVSFLVGFNFAALFFFVVFAFFMFLSLGHLFTSEQQWASGTKKVKTKFHNAGSKTKKKLGSVKRRLPKRKKKRRLKRSR